MIYNVNLQRRLFNDAYFPFLFDYTHRYEIYYGGSGSGKSVFVAQKLLYKACRSKRKILIVRKYATTLKDSVFQLMVDVVTQWKIYNYCKINLSNYTITLPNGSVFLFKGLDDSEKIKSIAGITDIWCEESTELTLDEYTQLDLRLRAMEPDLQLICSFNPVSKVNWVYKKWFADGVITSDNTMILKTTYKDNRFLPPEYCAALEEKQRSNPTYYRIYALGDFCTLDKLIFSNWEIGEAPTDTSKMQLLCGLDYGYTADPSAFIVSWLDEANKTLYVAEEWYKRGALNNEIAQQIKYMGHGKDVIIADSAEQKSIEEIRRDGVSRIRASVKGKGSVMQGIQKLQQYKIIVSPNCENVITELQNYSYKKDKQSGEYTNEPQDAYNHCMDALRYSLQCANTMPHIKVLNVRL